MEEAGDLVSLLRATRFLSREFTSEQALALYSTLPLLSLYSREITREDELPGRPLPSAAALRCINDAAWAMRYSAGTYGGAGRAYFELCERGSVGALRHVFKGGTAAFAAIVGIPKSALIATVGGRPGFPKSFLCIDATARAIVLSIRGTMSLNDCITDACGWEVPFCGGRSHGGLVKAARSVWSALEQDALKALTQHPGFSLVLTGHSLGAGAATLLLILLNYERAVAEGLGRRAPLSGVKVCCYAFASPPAFAPLALLPAEVTQSLFNFVHRGDIVARLSVTSLRELARVAIRCKEENSVSVLPFASLFSAPSLLMARTLAAEPQWASAWGCGGGSSSGASGDTSGSAGSAPVPEEAPAAAAAAAERLEIPGRIVRFLQRALLVGRPTPTTADHANVPALLTPFPVPPHFFFLPTAVYLSLPQSGSSLPNPCASQRSVIQVIVCNGSSPLPLCRRGGRGGGRWGLCRFCRV